VYHKYVAQSSNSTNKLVPNLAVRDEAVEPTAGGRRALIAGMSAQEGTKGFGGVFELPDGGLRLRDQQFNLGLRSMRLTQRLLRFPANKCRISPGDRARGPASNGLPHLKDRAEWIAATAPLRSHICFHS